MEETRKPGVVSIPVSIGELVDRVAILSIKAERIKDLRKRRLVLAELETLNSILEQQGIEEGSPVFTQLKDLNRRIWDMEEAIRLHEKEGRFDERFIELARLIYLTNDQRAAAKRSIDRHWHSAVQEVKDYPDYENRKGASRESH